MIGTFFLSQTLCYVRAASLLLLLVTVTLSVNFSHLSQERQSPDEARPAKLCLVSAVDVGSALAFIYIGVWYSVHSFRLC